MDDEKEKKELKRVKAIIVLVIIAGLAYLLHINNQYYEKRIERLEEKIYEYECKIDELNTTIETYQDELRNYE